MKQTFCPKCGGVKKVVVNGKVIPEKDWMKYGMASDIGCWCPPKK